MRILHVVGARPNFMKVAPVLRAMERRGDLFHQLLVHTGQHYDERMSASFFRDLRMPEPDINLGVGSGTHAQQTAMVMARVEPVMQEYRPDIVIVVGDVNSTLACALTATKLGIRVAHVEAGLRSGDKTMPEEINRICTDAISDDLFTTDRFADNNLLREGVSTDRIHFVGNVMIDSLLQHRAVAERLCYHEQLGVESGRYAVLTMHRPSNVEDSDKLREILEALCELAADMPILFPIHPRTRKRVMDFGLEEFFVDSPEQTGIRMIEPLGYLELLSLNMRARLVLTDSGGLQEETTILRVPCVTLRDNTERPITLSQGTNRLGGTAKKSIVDAIRHALAEPLCHSRAPDKWDGKAASRIAEIIASRAST
jgi:UDP-N-acetylglucosamine 2-epimerase (non-hydrolysing)